MNTLLRDVTFAIRMLRRSPGFTFIAILTLALGIGANTAVFTVVNSILLSPLPYPHSERLAALRTVIPYFPDFRLGESAANFDDIRAQNDVFDGAAMFSSSWQAILSGDGEPVRLIGQRVSPDLFTLLGAAPERGRLFTEREDTPGSESVAVISDQLWRSRYGADPNILGRKLKLDGKLYSVIGIMAPGFALNEAKLWAPLALTPQERANREMHSYSVLVRLKPGVSVKQAQAEMDALAARFSQQFPNEDKGIKFILKSLHEETVGNARTALFVLMGAVVLVLLIGCANVGSLSLARSIARQKEVAVRVALGASRGRIVRQFLIESLVLACLGGAAGWILGSYGVEVFRRLAPADTPRLADLRMDYGVFLFTLAISAFAAMLFGLAPALQSSRTTVGGALKETGPAGLTGTYGRQRLRSVLVVLEVGLALVLLASSALLIKSLSRLTHVDPGFRTDHLLTAGVSLPAAKYTSDAQKYAFFDELVGRLKSLPAESIAASSRVVLGDYLTMTTMVAEGAPKDAGRAAPTVEMQTVSQGFFSTLQIPFVRGRDFSAAETPKSPPVVIVNEAFARRFFPNADPIGKRINFNTDSSHKPDWHEVVGEVKDVRDVSPTAAARPEVYLSLQQNAADGFVLFFRTKADPHALVPSLRGIVQSLDAELPVTDVGTMDEALYTFSTTPRFQSILLMVFAGLGLLLSLIGIYGVIAITVAQQTREIGIRMALGAQPTDVMGLVLRRGMLWVAAGTAAGLAGAYGATRLLASLLFEVKATDPESFAIATALLIASALLACYIPARRAMRVDPMVALRYE
jgi:putative ABC transport system permease protein